MWSTTIGHSRSSLDRTAVATNSVECAEAKCRYGGKRGRYTCCGRQHVFSNRGLFLYLSWWRQVLRWRMVVPGAALQANMWQQGSGLRHLGLPKLAA